MMKLAGKKATRIVLYSHDTLGLGHLRRNLLIAHSLVDSNLKPNVLLISGAREISKYSLPQGIDFLTLPAIKKSNDGEYSARQLDISLNEIIALRARIIQSSVIAFEPDIIVVDNVPRGVACELDPLLKSVSSNPDIFCILGLRDILDEPSAIRQEWIKRQNEKVINDYYDEVWVYGDRNLYDLAHEYGFSEQIKSKLHYMGYLDPTRREKIGHQSKRNNLNPSKEIPQASYSLCMAGGGQDGIELVQTFTKSIIASGQNGVIVTGPFFPEDISNRLYELAGSHTNLTVIRFHEEPFNLIRHADRVVSMGGYNSICELLVLKKNAIIIPRIHPRKEQWIRACRLNEKGFIKVLHPNDLNSGMLEAWLLNSEQHPCDKQTLNFNGLDKILDRVMATIQYGYNGKEKPAFELSAV